MKNKVEKTLGYKCNCGCRYDDDYDYEADTWDAMTDGMYGDMPEDFNGDYSFLGY